MIDRICEDTAFVRPEERFAYWQDVVCGKYLTASAKTVVRDKSFDARLVSQDLGPLRVSELRAPLHFWSRDAADVRRDEQDVYMLSLLAHGRGELNQYGRRAVQGPGDIVLYDSSAVFQYDLDAETRLIKIPKALFDQRVEKPRDLVSVSFSRTVPLAPMLSAMITEATRLELSNPSQGLVGARLANAIIDVLIAMCDMFREDHADIAASSRLDKVLRHARANIGDRDLTPQSLAQIGGVSVRSLNRMFGNMGTTAMRWLWAERLQASRQALTLKQVSSITEAAFLFGFTDLGHFSRSYKDAFGEAPMRTLNKPPNSV